MKISTAMVFAAVTIKVRGPFRLLMSRGVEHPPDRGHHEADRAAVKCLLKAKLVDAAHLPLNIAEDL